MDLEYTHMHTTHTWEVLGDHGGCRAVLTHAHAHLHMHGCLLSLCCHCAAELTELFKEHKFVGCVDQTRALVQFLVCAARDHYTMVSQRTSGYLSNRDTALTPSVIIL